MSADTTVVVAACRFDGSELSYTAAVVQGAEDLFDEDREIALGKAQHAFLHEDGPDTWFQGEGGLGRAKQFAGLLAADYRERGLLEYESRPIIEIGRDRIYFLSRKGHRLPDRQRSRGRCHCGCED